ncbi:MAG TPA: hypothetical protein VI231_19140 [Candidatus Binatia bacterium]
MNEDPVCGGKACALKVARPRVSPAQHFRAIPPTAAYRFDEITHLQIKEHKVELGVYFNAGRYQRIKGSASVKRSQPDTFGDKARTFSWKSPRRMLYALKLRRRNR